MVGYSMQSNADIVRSGAVECWGVEGYHNNYYMPSDLSAIHLTLWCIWAALNTFFIFIIFLSC